MIVVCNPLIICTASESLLAGNEASLYYNYNNYRGMQDGEPERAVACGEMCMEQCRMW